MSIRSLLFSVPLLAACIAEPDIDVTGEPIGGTGAAPASAYQLHRAASVAGCTAIRISTRWALTAAHCMAEEEDDVAFYTTGPGTDSDEVAEVAKVYLPPGVSAHACNTIGDCMDDTGTYADIALLRLKSHDVELDETDLDGYDALLAYQYPGSLEPGVKVGAGNHDGIPNGDDDLRQIADKTSGDDDSGSFVTLQQQTDSGDAGGPFYYGNRVLGVHHGVNLPSNDDHYTSVPEHLKWILETIKYEWRGQPPQMSTKYTGTLIESFYGNRDECQYVCETTTSCEAYNYDLILGLNELQNCFLYADVTGVSTAGNWEAALKHGTRANASGNAVGYVRDDELDAVVHVTTGNRVHELVRKNGQWQWGDLQDSTAPAVGSGQRLTAYRRADGMNTVVYRSSANRIIELALDGTWTPQDLTTVTGGELCDGQPAAYVKADGVSAIVYRGATTGHIIELRLGSRGWIKRDLMAAAGSSTIAWSDPAVYVRSDGYSVVLFRSGDAIFELRQSTSGTWSMGSPSALAGAAAAVGRPFGFTSSSGTNAIVYRTAAGQIIQLTLAGTQWSAAQLATGAAGDPVAYTRTDLVEAVVFRNTANRIIEAAGGLTYDLTTHAGAPAANTNPAVYHRNDGFNSVVYETAAGHVRELTYKRDGTWGTADLTAVANETP
jgi:hypothetical protein